MVNRSNLVGKSPITVNIPYIAININAGNLLVMRRSQPVIAGNHLQSGGAVQCR